MHRNLAAFALLFFAVGCTPDPEGIVLHFPDAPSRMAATSADIQVIKPSNGTADACPQFLGGGQPQATDIEKAATITLVNGKASQSIGSGIPTGWQTVFVNVHDATRTPTLFLFGCKTATLGAGDKVTIELASTTGEMPDLEVPGDAAADMATPPPDMAQHKSLSITVTELRAAQRKLSGVTVTLNDSMGAVRTTPTDVNGLAKIDTIGLTAPFTLIANAPTTNAHTGITTLSGVTPTFTTDNVVMTMPIELDPPAAPDTLPLSVSDQTAAQNYDVFWFGTNGIASDPIQQHQLLGSAFPFDVGPLITGGSYRIAVSATGQKMVMTPSPVTSGALSLDFASLKSYGSSLTVNVVAAPGSYTTQKGAVTLMLPAAPTEAGVPIVSPAPIAGTSFSGFAPLTPSDIQGGAVVETELFADGPLVHAESRHQLTAPITSPATDTFTAVPAPPGLTITPSPSPLPAAMSLSISASLPSGFTLSKTFVHVLIHDGPAGAAPTSYAWHVIAPAANPTVVAIPGGVLTAGNYSVDVAYVQDFTLPDGTIQASLTNNYSKLLRTRPQVLSQSSFNLTVN